MGILDIFRPDNGHKEITLSEMLDRYDIVNVNEQDAVILVTDKGASIEAADPDTDPRYVRTELGGGSSQYVKVFQEEYKYNLRGVLGIQKYMEMRNDAAVRTTLRIAKTPILAARWYMEPGSSSERDRKIAEYVWRNLEQGMRFSWYQFLNEALNMLDYGFYLFEKVFDINSEGLVYWKKLAPRHPVEVLEFIYDNRGGPQKVRMVANNRVRNEVNIPIEKLLIFTYDEETGNLQGRSLLRSAYKHWFYKENLYKIDAIQKERHGIGIPVIKLPPNYSPQDKLVADSLGKSLRTNEEAHVTLPPGWDMMFAKLEGQKVDALESAEHHKNMLYENVIANFVTSRTADETSIMENTFLKASRYVAEIVRGTLNKYAIPQLVDYNWKVDKYPELRVRRLGETADWRTLSFAIRNFVGAGVVRPDDRMEAWVREELDIPHMDPDTVREVLPGRGTPQLPAVGQPRQSTASGLGTGSGPVGQDRSGG